MTEGSRDRPHDGGKMVVGEYPRIMAGYRVEYHRLELADVPREMEGGKQVRHFGRRDRFCLVERFCRILDKMIEEQGNVLDPFPQGWQVNVVGAEPVIEVLPKFSSRHQLFQVVIGSDDNP